MVTEKELPQAVGAGADGFKQGVTWSGLQASRTLQQHQPLSSGNSLLFCMLEISLAPSEDARGRLWRQLSVMPSGQVAKTTHTGTETDISAPLQGRK